MKETKHKKGVYAFYKGDTFIDLGTKAELSERLGLSLHTIDFYTKPVYRKRVKGNDGICVFRIDDD